MHILDVGGDKNSKYLIEIPLPPSFSFILKLKYNDAFTREKKKITDLRNILSTEVFLFRNSKTEQESIKPTNLQQIVFFNTYKLGL